ncbi:MAG: hypothetical protein GWN47_11350 [Woeseiaceae bacterium]|nr:hypothetical protein [Woeseiaceae bacterium]
MNSRIDQITKGLISLAVMLMFTVAFIAGQARANLPANELTIDDSAQRSDIGIMLDAESLRKLHSLTHLVETALALPIDIEILLNDLAPHNDSSDRTGSDESLVK